MTSTLRDRTLRTENRNHLPLPTGPYPVIGYYDIMTGSDKNDGILVRLLYPALNQEINVTEKVKEWPSWYPHDNYRIGYCNVAKINWTPFVKLFNCLAPEAFIPILQNVDPLRLTDQKFPIIIFSHGLASCRTTYSSICYELASYGFIIAFLEHRDQSACMSFYPSNTTNSSEPYEWVKYLHSKQLENFELRTKQLEERVSDVYKTLLFLQSLHKGEDFQNLLAPVMEHGKFEGLLDLDNIILMGHSFGSSTTIKSLLTLEERVKLGVCLDAWMYPIKDLVATQVTKPLLFVNMETFQIEKNLKKMKEYLQNNGKNSEMRKVFTIKEAKHTDQSDLPFIISSLMSYIFKMGSKVDPFLVHDVTTALTLEFLAHHLNIKLRKDKNEFIEEYRKHLTEGITLID